MTENLDEFDAAASERAAYIHIPFCRRRCPYCDFAVVDLSATNPSIERYVDAVVAEVEMEAPWEPLHALNFGGGTPSALTPQQIGRLIEAVKTRFGLVSGAEVSIEANPEDWTEPYAVELVAAGVNRVSLGVQSFDDAVLASLGRAHTADEAMRAIGSAYAAGVENVSIDLIYGTPGESAQSWAETVNTALALDTDHLSAYSLTVERGTELSRAVAAGAPAPDDDDQADKFEVLEEVASAQFRRYEVSNWAVPGKECRYNLTTWAQGEYLGFGLGAHGHREQERRRNVRRLDAYLEMIERGDRAEAGREKLSEWEKDKERLFLGLRRRTGVVAGRAGSAFLDSDVGQRYVGARVLTVDGNRLVVAKPLLTDAVVREIIALPPPPL